jgi:hypothetical protein
VFLLRDVSNAKASNIPGQDRIRDPSSELQSPWLPARQAQESRQPLLHPGAGPCRVDAATMLPGLDAASQFLIVAARGRCPWCRSDPGRLP